MTSKTSVPDGWRRVRLGDVASIRGEASDPIKDESSPYIALEHIVSGGVLTGFGRSSDSISLKTKFRTGDTLYGKLRPNLRKAIRVNFDGVCSTEILVIYGEARGDGGFLSHIIRSDQLHRHSMQGVAGTKMPRTSWGHLKTFEFMSPSLLEQRAIAAVLDSIDDAIERTEGVISATEQLRDSLLDELLTRGVPGWHTAWKYVPGLGMMPADWEVVSLGEVCEVTSGLAMGPQRIPRSNPKPYLTVANVQANHVMMGEKRFMELTKAEYQSRTLRTGDVVLVEGHAQIMQLGRAAIVPPAADGFTFQNHLFRVQTSKRCDAVFVCAYVNSRSGRRYFGSFGGTTSGLNTVSAANVKALPLPLPLMNEQNAIVAALGRLDETLDRARTELESLESLKQSTADALLTGRVRMEG